MNGESRTPSRACGDGGAGDRRARLEHLAACAACRARLAADDPSRLFSLLALDPPPAELLDGVSRDVARAVRSGAPAWRVPQRRALVALAAAALLALLLGAPLFRGPVRAPATVAVRQAEVPARATPAGEAGEPGGRQVYELTVGETEVLMIFDKRLRL